MIGAFTLSGALLDPLPAIVGDGESTLIHTDDILSHPTGARACAQTQGLGSLV